MSVPPTNSPQAGDDLPMTCATCQALLWDLHFELLDAPEDAAVRAHVAACAACTTAWRQVQNQARLVARAARAEGTTLRFVAPTAGGTIVPADTPRAHTPLRNAAMAPDVERRSWLRLAWAASLLLIVGGMGSFAFGVHLLQSDAEKARVARREKMLEISEARKPWREAEAAVLLERESLAALQASLPQRRAAAELAALRRERAISVVAPAAVEPGAPHQAFFSVRNFQGEPADANITARLVDGRGQELRGVEQLAVQRLDVGQYVVSFRQDTPWPKEGTAKLEVAATTPDGHAVPMPSIALPSAAWLAHLATDKPVYVPGETVRLRAVVVDRFALTPSPDAMAMEARLVDTEGRDRLTLPLTSPPAHEPGPKGWACGQFILPLDANPGDYSIVVSQPDRRFAPESVSIRVRSGRPARFRVESRFDQAAYAANRDVNLRCRLTRRDNAQPVARHVVFASLTADGKAVPPSGRGEELRLAATTDAQGDLDLRLRLPAHLDRGEVVLTLTILDPQGEEAHSLAVPVDLRRVEVQCYPEGGDLIAGVENRVYFRALNPAELPVAISGRLVDRQGKEVARLHTPSAGDMGVTGLGTFTLRPKLDEEYTLKLDEPADAVCRLAWPQVSPQGLALSVPSGVTAPGQPMQLHLHNAGPARKLVVGLYCRGRTLGHHRLALPADGTAQTAVRPEIEVGGVVRVTVFEEKQVGDRQHLVPLAERLVFRRPARELALEATPLGGPPSGSRSQRLGIKLPTEAAAPTWVTLSVLDSKVANWLNISRSLPTQLLITHEVRRPEDLENADFLLTDRPAAARQVDLLLGTQGWRRFAEQAPAEFRQRFGYEAERLAMTTPALQEVERTQPVDPAQREAVLAQARADDEAKFQTELGLRAKAVAAREQAALALAEQLRPTLQRLHADAETLTQTINATVARLGEFQRRFSVVLFVVAAGVLIVVVSVLAYRSALVAVRDRITVPIPFARGLEWAIPALVVAVVATVGGAMLVVQPRSNDFVAPLAQIELRLPEATLRKEAKGQTPPIDARPPTDRFETNESARESATEKEDRHRGAVVPRTGSSMSVSAPPAGALEKAKFAEAAKERPQLDGRESNLNKEVRGPAVPTEAKEIRKLEAATIQGIGPAGSAGRVSDGASRRARLAVPSRQEPVLVTPAKPDMKLAERDHKDGKAGPDMPAPPPPDATFRREYAFRTSTKAPAFGIIPVARTLYWQPWQPVGNTATACEFDVPEDTAGLLLLWHGISADGVLGGGIINLTSQP